MLGGISPQNHREAQVWEFVGQGRNSNKKEQEYLYTLPEVQLLGCLARIEGSF